MKISSIIVTESRNYLYEGLEPKHKKSVFLWESAGVKLIEANLTPDQITQIFSNIEQGITSAGGNRTMLGKGVDAASAVNKAWEDLKTKVQNSGPIKNVDAMYDQAAEKLKQATGGDQGVMKYVQMYRDFAKKHPIAQSFIYAALIAAAGISGAGLGGAAALGLFKMTDKLLQGEKFSSAAYQGAKTGGMAYAAGQIGQALKGQPQGEVPAGATSSKADQMYDKLAAQHQAAADRAASVGGSGTISAMKQQVGNEAAKAVRQAIANGADPSNTSDLESIAQAAIEKYGSAYGGPISQQSIETMAAKAAMIAQQGLKENTNLTTQQINLIFEHVSDSIILEGITDFVKGAASKAMNWAQTKGRNLTTTITADKLMQAWKKAGSPTDSDQLKQIMVQAGVPENVINNTYSTMKISASVTQAATTAQPSAPQAPAATTSQPTAKATAKKPAAPNAMAQMTQQLTQPTKSSTGGTISTTQTGIKHTASPNNPNVAQPAKTGLVHKANPNNPNFKYASSKTLQ